MENRSLTELIIAKEWKQFDKVKNEGGRAACQDDWEAFRIMRQSQFVNWPDKLLESYYDDLKAADIVGYNLITEKYGRMMKSTAPQRYEEIKKYFPVRSEERIKEQERIIAIEVAMNEEFVKNYPCYGLGGRPIHTSQDTAYITSMETYLRGEISTWSDRTFELYAAWMDGLVAAGQSLPYMVAGNMLKEYGFVSVEDAEAFLKTENKGIDIMD